MARFEFKIVDTKYFAMSQEERIAALNKVEEEYKAAAAKGETWDESKFGGNPFPKWVRDYIRGFGDAKFDRENGVYKVRTKSDNDDDAEDEYAAFKAGYAAEAKLDAERQKWYDTHHITASIAFEDEDAAMNELEAYLGGSPAAKKRSKGKEIE